ncbi:DUF402 domain-containing protein [Nocardioides alkalitolerans]|uniref:DUF402 domain-containing protein n=1 Tax=Nocardioides alkalitolerans TaxID=281714 RepID=UPI000427A0CD|nr:DUF402 domain-containing protein [Nocardioides alkalitolerans]
MLPGTPVRVEMTKLGDHPHWRFTGRYLGADEHGDWIGFPAGTHHVRPGLAFDSDVDSVTLVRAGAHHLASLHAPGLWCDVYVDMATPPVWDHSGDVAVVRSVDLDLDVVRRDDGTVFVDDEDEFAEHRVSLGYPAELVAAAERARDEVRAAVVAGVAPYDEATRRRWLGALTALDLPRPGR